MGHWLLLALSVLGTSQVLPYDAARMRLRIDEAIVAVRQILDTTRHPSPIDDVPHVYDDLYLLAEFLTNTAIKAELNALSIVGLGPLKSKQARDWVADSRDASLGFQPLQTCTLVEQEATDAQTTGKGAKGAKGKAGKLFAANAPQTWAVNVSWSLFISKDKSNSTADQLILDSRSATFHVTTSTKQAPDFCSTSLPLAWVQLTWLFQQVQEQKPVFSINRSAPSCYTPRRNDDISKALQFFLNITTWASQVVETIFNPTLSQGLAISKTPDDTGVFIPIVPLFEPARCSNNTGAAGNSTCTPTVLLSVDDMNAFLATQLSSLKSKAQSMSESFPDSGNSTALLSTAEARLVMVCIHLTRLAGAYSDSMESIEAMLRDRLVDALGTHIAPTDLTQYMRFNNRRLFNAETRPQEFSYPIRREGCDPSGAVIMEQGDNKVTIPQPVTALTRTDPVGKPMKMTSTDGTVASLAGRRYLHAPVFYQFSGQPLPSVNLVARAKQFAWLIFVVGKIVSNGEFEIEIATIVKDKEDLVIPLVLDTLSSPKVYYDILASLSPQQQAFAEAYRNMLLKQSVFALAVVEVKPQLEYLLNLSVGSLTKEVQLTQDLIKLFVDYQMPPDMLTYIGESTDTSTQIEYVKAQVTKMNDMLDQARQQEIIKKRVNEAVNNSPHDDYDYDDVFNEPSNRSKVNSARQQPRPLVQLNSTQVQPNTTDYTLLPALLESRIQQLDPDAGLSATTISLGKMWTLFSKQSVQSPVVTTKIDSTERAADQSQAIRLLTALSKSGTIPFEHSELHTLVPFTQSFDETLINIVVQEDKNPIDAVERSSLVIATTIFNQPAKDLVAQNQVSRLTALFPELF